MLTYPKKDARAKTGSNLRRNPLLPHRAALNAERDGPFQGLASAFNRQTRRLFSKADRRHAAEIAQRVREDFRRASLELRGAAAKIAALKASARRMLDRQLSRALPSYRQLQAHQKQHAREYARLAKVVPAWFPTGEAHIAWGDLVEAEPEGLQEFTAPYPLFDVHTVDPHGLMVDDLSFARPTSGELVNKFTFDHDEDTPAILGLYGFIRPEPASSLASLGVTFTLPRAGRLQIGAALRSLYNQITFSVEDNFGFSSANLTVRLELFVDVLRPGQVIHIPRTLLTYGLVSRGSDLSYTMSGLDNTLPYVLNAITDERMDAGDQVQVVVGSEVHVESELDDMESHVDATVWWYLQKVTVTVVD